MVRRHTTGRRVVGVYALVCIAVVGVTRFAEVAPFDGYMHLAVAAIFLLTAIRLTRHDAPHYGVSLAGLLESPEQGEPQGFLGLPGLGRALVHALPSAGKETAIAIAVAAVVFPLYAIGYALSVGPTAGFSLVLPPNPASLALAQVVVVALPEEAFFRGWLQTELSDFGGRRVRVLGAEVSAFAWVGQAALFAALHFFVEPDPARLAVFFPGLLFGWLRAWRGGIGAAIALHAMSNLYSEILARSWL